MDENLERYLNDHLAGSVAAVDTIELLADRSETEEGRKFYTDLLAKVEKDREVLDGLLKKAGQDRSGFLEAAGELTAKASRLKLRWEGLSPGSLGLLEAIEILALGIEGKRRLWLLLDRIVSAVPEWEATDFKALEADAEAQGQAVEQRRILAGKAVFMQPAAAGSAT
jgi:hypothetical protein